MTLTLESHRWVLTRDMAHVRCEVDPGIHDPEESDDCLGCGAVILSKVVRRLYPDCARDGDLERFAAACDLTYAALTKEES